MIKTIDAVGSSNIEKIEYNEEERELCVTFKGGSVYAYADVPAYKATELEEASSKGSYINQNIKPESPCTRIFP